MEVRPRFLIAAKKNAEEMFSFLRPRLEFYANVKITIFLFLSRPPSYKVMRKRAGTRNQHLSIRSYRIRDSSSNSLSFLSGGSGTKLSKFIVA